MSTTVDSSKAQTIRDLNPLTITVSPMRARLRFITSTPMAVGSNSKHGKDTDTDMRRTGRTLYQWIRLLVHHGEESTIGGLR